MLNKTLLTMIFALATINMAVAQNKIDKMVENFSAVGKSHFTSAVERDPKTRAVKKVVKVLEVNPHCGPSFVSAFREESSKGNYSEQINGNKVTQMIVVSGKNPQRIYMLNTVYGDRMHYNPVEQKVTVIIKYK